MWTSRACTCSPAAWPSAGRIEFSDAVLRYSVTTPPALKGVSFAIEPGEHVGVVGRSGSGKSTLITALLRLRELEAGAVRIDGVDVSSVPLRQLRSGVACLMQEPLLFSGTLRANLDPHGGAHTDAALAASLRRVGLVDTDAAALALLDQEMGEAGDNWSNGQRQLICMARALLSETTVFILDEATSSLDPQSDAVLQAALKTACRGVTTFTVAHRLDTIIDSDKVLVLDAGAVVEYGPPAELAADPSSAFAKLLAAAEHEHEGEGEQ